jgi:hypothetical protein
MQLENRNIYRGFHFNYTWIQQTRDRILHSETYQLTTSIWNKEELPQRWKELITVPIYETGDITDCSNVIFIQNCIQYLVLGLAQVVNETIGDHQCRYRCER